MKYILAAVIFLMVQITAPLQAQGAEQRGPLKPRSFPTLGMQAFSYTSKSMDRNYDILVRFPFAYQQNPNKKFPTLVITDGNRFFSSAASALMAVEAELQEPMIIVAVGTPFEEGHMAYNVRRVHEFSPPNWDLSDPFGQTVAATCKQGNVPAANCIGGAPKFLNFLSKELLPGLSRGIRIDMEKLTLGGVSAGGYFASWAMFQEVSPFKNYIISSPAMAYGDGEIFRAEKQYAESNNDLNIGVYLGSGSLEMTHPYLEGVGKVVSGQAHFSGVLAGRGYQGLKLHSEIHQGMGHIDTAPVTFARGLRLLFGKN